MAEETGGRLYPVEELRAFTLRAFTTAGVPDEDAQIVTDNLIEANLRGVDTHGITRLLAIYVKRLKVGIVKARPEIKIVGDNPSAIVVDGDNGLGAVVGTFAMREAIRRAGETGACWAGVRNSNHFGATAYFTQMAARRDMVGIGMTNGPASMAPWGGSKAYMSTNPFSFAVPAEGEPVIIDMGVRHRGYLSDLTRTIWVGEPSPRLREVYNIVYQANAAAIAGIRPGLSGKESDQIGRDVIEAAGHGEQFVHGLGHGVGVRIHEAPSMGKTHDNVLPEGAVVTIEPGIYIPEWGGVRIEDVGVLERDGLRVLTRAPKPDLREMARA